MLASLNEIERTVERAARGSGAPPGADTELGLGTAWLEARGIAVLGSVARALEGLAGDAGMFALGGVPGRRSLAGHGARIAVHALPALVDLAVADAEALGEATVTAVAVEVPALLIPVASGYAATGLAFELAWSDAKDGRAARVAIGPSFEPAGSLTAGVGRDVVVTCRRAAAGSGDAAPSSSEPLRFGVNVPDDAWRVLLTLAHRTYVPASPLSRSRGAGAEVDDSA